MQLYDPAKLGAPNQGFFQPKEKKRLMFLLVGALVVAGAVFTVKMQSGKQQAAGFEALQQERPEEFATEIAKPVIDVASLEAAASDELPEQRVVLSGATLDAGFAAATHVYDGVYAALGGRELTAEIAAEILRAPKQHRGQLLRTRCFVDELRELSNPQDPTAPRSFLRGHLEDGAPVFLAVQEFELAAPEPGGFVRVDGLFLRVHRQEVEGKWIEAPLFVGPRAGESFPKLAPVTALDAEAFANLRDDSVDDGFTGLDHATYWQLISYVKHLPPDAVDWSKAQVLDNTTIQSIFADGSEWRGKPVRLPVALMLDIWKAAQKENPLRLDHLVEGWCGNGTWTGQAKLIHFVAPFDEIPPNSRKEVTVRGFFYKNLGYTPRYGGAAIAPFLVVESIEKFTPPDPAGLRHMTYIVAGSLLVIGVVVFFLLRRDKKSSAALEAELLRRRRERRQKLAPAPKA